MTEPVQRIYRATVRGRFGAIDADRRAQLLDEQGDHDMFSARFIPEGAFLYEPSLIGFQYRYEVRIDGENPADADELAKLEAEENASADLAARHLDGRIVSVSTMCVNDLKVRRKKDSR